MQGLLEVVPVAKSGGRSVLSGMREGTLLSPETSVKTLASLLSLAGDNGGSLVTGIAHCLTALSTSRTPPQIAIGRRIPTSSTGQNRHGTSFVSQVVAG